MIQKTLYFLVYFLFFYSSLSCFSQNRGQKIIFIRHGEKPDKGDNLSCKGLSRALQLSEVLYNKIGLPNQIDVPTISMGKSTSTARMYQTIVPFAVKYNLSINSKYDVKDIQKIASHLRQLSGTTLLVWEHKNIIKIVSALGIKEGLSWDDNDFDSIWIITFSNGIINLSKDKEGITPSASCP